MHSVCWLPIGIFTYGIDIPIVVRVTLSTNVSKEEAEQIEEYVDGHEMTVSELLREAARKEIQREEINNE